jgi:hypothetical protein
MMVIYVEDCGIGAANPKDIDKLVDDLDHRMFSFFAGIGGGSGVLETPHHWRCFRGRTRS